MSGYGALKLFVKDESIRAPLTQPTGLISVLNCIADYLIFQFCLNTINLIFFAFKLIKVEKYQRIKDFPLNIDGFATINKVNFSQKFSCKFTSNTN